jgi:predicted outer membrane repeat protein
MSLSANSDLTFDKGQLSGNAQGLIYKTGSGNVSFAAGATINFGGTFNISAGGVYFSTSAALGKLDIGNATLGLNVDFGGSDTSHLYTGETHLSENSKLNVSTKAAPAKIVGSSTAIMFADTVNIGFSTNNIISANANGYRFKWNENTGWLIYGALPWSSYVNLYQTAENEEVSIAQDIKATTGDEKPFAVAGKTNFTLSGYNGALYAIDASNKSAKGLTVNGSSITIKNLTFKNFAGGAISVLNGAKIIFRDEVNFTNNTAGENGAAIHNAGELIFSGANITFSQNSADIYQTELGTTTINGAGNVYFGGGIEGSGLIEKSGSAKVYFEAGSKTNFSGTLNITGGGVYFATSAVLGKLDIGNATLGLDVDFDGIDTSYLYTGETRLSENSKLSVSTKTAPAKIVGSSTAIMFADSANIGFSTSNIISANANGYRFAWNENTGWLIYGALPWNSYVNLYQKETGGDTIYLAENITAMADDYAFADTDGTNFTLSGYNGVYTIDANNVSDNKGLTVTNSSITIKDLTFKNFNGRAITVTGSTITFTDTVNFTDNAGEAIYNEGRIIFETVSGKNITFNGNSRDIYQTANATTTINGTGSLIINSGIEGAGLITKDGSATFYINADSNLYTGAFEQNGGKTVISSASFGGVHKINDGSELVFAQGASFTSGSIYSLKNNSVMTISADNDLILNNQLRGDGTISKTGKGALTLEGNITFEQGTLNATKGEVALASGASYTGKALNLNGATLNMQNGSAQEIIVNNFSTDTNLKIDIFNDGTSDKIIAAHADINGNIDIQAGVGKYDNVS